MTNTNIFQSFQPWMDMTTATATKFFNLNAKTFENLSKIQMGFVGECSNIMGKFAQDVSNPKDLANMPNKLSSEFNSLTQQAVQHNQQAFDALLESSTHYRQF